MYSNFVYQTILYIIFIVQNYSYSVFNSYKNCLVLAKCVAIAIPTSETKCKGISSIDGRLNGSTITPYVLNRQSTFPNIKFHRSLYNIPIVTIDVDPSKMPVGTQQMVQVLVISYFVILNSTDLP